MTVLILMGRDEENERSTESADNRPERERPESADDRPERERPESADDRSPTLEPTANDRTPTLEPATDEATVELVRDAVGVARGELSDETFFEKYDVGTEDRQVDDE